MLVWLITGQARHGKDSAAQILQGLYEAEGKKVAILHFADMVKHCARAYFNWDGEKDEKGRTLLQWLGSDLAGDNEPYVWVDIVSSLIRGLQSEFDIFIVPDLRFRKEHYRMRATFPHCKTILIRRENEDGSEFDNGLTKEQKLHRSETQVKTIKPDYVVRAKDLGVLYQGLTRVVELEKGKE